MGLFAASAGNAIIGSNAASGAAKAQTSADKSALALQQSMFDQTQQNLAPYMQAGTGSLNQYQNLIGGNGTAVQNLALQGLTQSPLYQNMINQGDKAILANASATGGLRSGNVQDSLANFDANALAQAYQSQIGNLGSLVSLGENASANLGNTGVQYANLGTNTYGDIGAARAGGILGSAGAITGGINQFFNGAGQLIGMGGF